MVARKKGNRSRVSLPAGIALGVGTSLLAALLGAALVAWLTGRERLPEDGMGLACTAILLAASLLGSAIAAGRIGEKRLAVCMCCGLVFFLLLLSCTALFFGGQYQGIAWNALAIFLGSGICVLLGLKGERRKKIHPRKYASR